MHLPSPIFRAALNAMNRNSLTGLAPIADTTAVARSSRSKLRLRCKEATLGPSHRAEGFGLKDGNHRC